MHAGILANFGLIVAGAFTRFVSYTLAKDNETLSLQVRMNMNAGQQLQAVAGSGGNQPWPHLRQAAHSAVPDAVCRGAACCRRRCRVPQQILTAAIIAMTGLMCFVKRYVDTSILPYVSKQPGGKKEKKKGDSSKGGGGEPKKKAGTWELLTSSPRILNMTLMVGRCGGLPCARPCLSACSLPRQHGVLQEARAQQACAALCTASSSLSRKRV